MSRIRQLEPLVINKIAAGEVIERPASVVKELLENSVDALSTRIEVDVAQGGSELIRIVDDGQGIHPDDFLLAVTSHATSKIASADDLFHVQTMGFRGEALASIASVSRFRIRSRTHDSDTACEMEVRGGEVIPPKPCGGPAGTLIEVRQLFGNTPVRRKFMKTTATEFGHITEHFTRVALANPRLHLVLRHNGKVVYELPATNRLLERLELFFGSQLAEHLIWVESESGETRMTGYVAHPSQSKSTRKSQHLFLNGRWIQDRALQHALTEAYRGLLMVGRQPIAFLFFDVPPADVDVNVHPTKTEVRFRDSQTLYRQLLSTLRTKFLGMDLDSEFALKSGAAPLEKPAPPPERQLELQTELADWAKSQLHSEVEKIGSQPPVFTSPNIGFQPAGDTSPAMPVSEEDHTEAPTSTGDSFPQPATVDAPAGPILRSRVMQVLNTYLVMESGEGLMVIDQHALHERVLYEHLRNRVLAESVESQKLLVPLPVEMSPSETALLLANQDVLAQLGFGVEEFGKSTVLLTAYPAMLAKADHVRLVRDIAEQLDGGGKQPSRRDLFDSLLHMMSCKAAIKAGQPLAPEEMNSLLEQRHLIDDAHHCPHGRPTALVLSREQLDRQFGRLG